jgi:hypothetical protein
MISWQKGIVTALLQDLPQLQELEVTMRGELCRAWNYPPLTGRAEQGDQLCLNTTAVELELGSGGYHFVIANLSRAPQTDAAATAGHIMKLRYTPLQLKVLSAEEEASPCRREVAAADSLNGTPVVVGTLHSMLAPAVAGALACHPQLKIVYLMTDGAALYLPLSRTVRQLRERGMLAGTVTAGDAFGGELEAVTVYSGLLAAVAALHADLVVVTMGPGIVGTGTRWGTTALEQGEIINAVNILGGRAVAIPRLSFADPRERHRGVSHHTLTALGRVALTPATVVLPVLPADQTQLIDSQLRLAEIGRRHTLETADGQPALDYLAAAGISVRSMGRGPADDPAFFLAAGAAGCRAAEMAAE